MIGATQKGGLWTLTIDRQEKAYSWTRAILAALDAVAVLPVVLKAADGPDSGLQRFGKCTVTW